MLALQGYGSSDDEGNGTKEIATESSISLDPDIKPEFSVQKQIQICAAPVVVPTVS